MLRQQCIKYNINSACLFVFSFLRAIHIICSEQNIITKRITSKGCTLRMISVWCYEHSKKQKTKKKEPFSWMNKKKSIRPHSIQGWISIRERYIRCTFWMKLFSNMCFTCLVVSQRCVAGVHYTSFGSYYVDEDVNINSTHSIFQRAYSNMHMHAKIYDQHSFIIIWCVTRNRDRRVGAKNTLFLSHFHSFSRQNKLVFYLIVIRFIEPKKNEN